MKSPTPEPERPQPNSVARGLFPHHTAIKNAAASNENERIYMLCCKKNGTAPQNEINEISVARNFAIVKKWHTFLHHLFLKSRNSTNVCKRYFWILFNLHSCRSIRFESYGWLRCQKSGGHGAAKRKDEICPHLPAIFRCISKSGTYFQIIFS